MKLHTDIPTRAQIERLLRSRAPSSVSVYLRTDPMSPGDGERIELKNLTAEAVRQLEVAHAPRPDIAEIVAELAELGDDDEFWRYQARSLALLVTPTALITFRPPNRLVGLVEGSDRFHLKPLLRSVPFPQLAFVLALAQGSVRLLEVAADLEATAVHVEDIPASVAAAVGKSSITDRSPSRRIQGSEGRKIRMRQYTRQIDQSFRPLLNGLETPLILAASVIDEIARRVWLSSPVHEVYSREVRAGKNPASPTSLIGRRQRPLRVLHAQYEPVLERLNSQPGGSDTPTAGSVSTQTCDFCQTISSWAWKVTRAPANSLEIGQSCAASPTTCSNRGRSRPGTRPRILSSLEVTVGTPSSSSRVTTQPTTSRSAA